MARYLIPKPIQRQYELFPGWGFTQVGLVAVGLIMGAAFFAGMTALRLGPIWLRLVIGVFFVAVVGFMAFPPPNEQPLYKRLQAGVGFSKSTRRWLYDWNASDWPE